MVILFGLDYTIFVIDKGETLITGNRQWFKVQRKYSAEIPKFVLFLMNIALITMLSIIIHQNNTLHTASVILLTIIILLFVLQGKDGVFEQDDTVSL